VGQKGQDLAALTPVAALTPATGAPALRRDGSIACVEGLGVLPLAVGASGRATGEQDVLLQLVEMDRLRLELIALVAAAAKLLVAQRRARPLRFVAVSERAFLGGIDGRDWVVVRRIERVEIERARRRRRRRRCGASEYGRSIGQPHEPSKTTRQTYWDGQSGSESQRDTRPSRQRSGKADLRRVEQGEEVQEGAGQPPLSAPTR
jgi:hypothetical protein